MTSRLNMIANIAKGPWIVRKAVGEQAICIIGRSLPKKSMVATAVVHLALGYLTTLTVDLAFLIEGQSESELPEKMLGAIRFSELDVASARHIELTSEE
ncbi:UNVERIFIED_CONTAM: protein ENHANCED DISEASE RESISTANCE 2-like [Sesamum latifolium]|uniref:Protein ENHANCED DISEASE RESISTANCE 2-like n=1 Tax=Sesamum latifolium TaxID=2727402 RepID=A0AAW2XQS7_9LAMI